MRCIVACSVISGKEEVLAYLASGVFVFPALSLNISVSFSFPETCSQQRYDYLSVGRAKDLLHYCFLRGKGKEGRKDIVFNRGRKTLEEVYAMAGRRSLVSFSLRTECIVDGKKDGRKKEQT